MWHIDPSGKMRDRFRFEAYHSGHMVYLISDVLEKATDDIREFIKATIPAEGIPAKYGD